MKSFTTKLKTEQIQVDDKPFTIRELTGRQRDIYLDGMRDKMSFTAEGKLQTVKSFEGLQADLLCLCLYDENGNAVSKEIINNYPATVQTEMFEMAQEVSKLTLKAATEAKNV